MGRKGYRPRNKIAALPIVHRMLVCRMLADSRPYNEIRATLAAAGVPKHDLPFNSSFLAYRPCREYQDFLADLLGTNFARKLDALLQVVLDNPGATGRVTREGAFLVESTDGRLLLTIEDVHAFLKRPENG